MKKNPRKITEQELQYIKEEYLSGKPISLIAKDLDRYPDVIRHNLEKIGIYKNSVNYMTDEELKGIIVDYNNGMTTKDIGEKYHRSDGYIINLLKKNKVYKRILNRLTSDEWEKISQLYKDGDFDEIFRLYPTLSKASLYSKMSKLKISGGKQKPWSDEDIQIVKDNYEIIDAKEIFNMIGERHSISAIQSLASKELGLSKSRDWTDDETSLFSNVYPTLPINEVLNLFPNRSLESLRNKAKKMKLNSYYRENIYWNKEDEEFLKNNWETMSDYKLSIVLNRNEMGIKDKRNLLGLYRGEREYQGYKDLKELLRGHLNEWKRMSSEKCSYKCILTGNKDYHVHHLFGFNDIFISFARENNLDNNINNYSYDELNQIIEKFNEFHNSYPLGVCVRPDLHMLFHDMYGKNKNNPDQWDEFKNLYNSNLLKINQ